VAEADLLLLLATLRYRLGPRLKSAGITLHWGVTDVPRLPWLTPHTSLRIVQEAFSNILKHTQASEIRVATGADEKKVWVSIADNERASTCKRRAGAAELGGEMWWDTSAAGTRLLLLLPLDAV
jgi:signal transduction histidine kinase